MFLSERIKNVAPANGNYYRLMVDLPDGSYRYFPSEPGAYFRIGDSPYGVPSGKYTLCFYDGEYRALPDQDRIFDINLQNEVHRVGQPQLALHLTATNTPGAHASDAGVSADTRLNRPAAAPHAEARQSSSVPGAEPSPAARQGKESDVEFQKYLHAMDLEERQQDFIKNSAYVTEVGELFALNRIMRRELVEMQRLIVLHSQQAYRDIEHVKGLSRDFLQLQKEILASAAENLSRPPAAPPDFVGLGHSALSAIKEIGVALINRSQPREKERSPLSKSTSAQLPAHPEDASSAQKVPAADIIDKIAQKLKRSSDEEIALAMSSPEKWKALFDEMLTSESASGSAANNAMNETK